MRESEHAGQPSTGFRSMLIVLGVGVLAGCNSAPDDAAPVTAQDSPADIASPPLEAEPDPSATPSPDESEAPVALNENDPADSPHAGPSRPGDDMQSAIVHARELLQSGKFRQFMEWYIPVDDLRDIRDRDEMEVAVSAMSAEFPPVVPALVELLKFLEGQTPRMESDGAIAVYAMDEFLFGSAEEDATASPTAVVETVVDEETPVPPGYGGDLTAVLSAAAADLEAGDSAAFVLKMFPERDAFVDVTEQLVANPQMTDAMLADLRAVAELTPDMDESGAVATFTFPGKDAVHPDRVVKFELVSGNWRLYDAAAPIREIVLAQSQKEPTWVANVDARYEVRFERLADNWRMVEMPDFMLLMSRPRSDGAEGETEEISR